MIFEGTFERQWVCTPGSAPNRVDGRRSAQQRSRTAPKIAQNCRLNQATVALAQLNPRAGPDQITDPPPRTVNCDRPSS